MRLASLRLLSALGGPSSLLAYELSWHSSVSLTGPGLGFFICACSASVFRRACSAQNEVLGG